MSEAPVTYLEQEMVPVKQPGKTAGELITEAGVTPEMLSEYVYTVNQGSRPFTDLTIGGVRFLANIANITIDECSIISEDEDSVTVQAVAIAPNGSRYYGSTQQQKFMGDKVDPSFMSKAFGKAQRNAAKGLLPVELLVKAIARSKGKPVGDERESKLETARVIYLEQKAKIEELNAKIADLEGAKVALESENAELKSAKTADAGIDAIDENDAREQDEMDF